MKKIVCILISLVLSGLMLSAQVYKKGLELSDNLFEISENKEFLQLIFTVDSEVLEYYESISDNFKKSKNTACYKIDIDNNKFVELYGSFLDELSPATKKYYNKQKLLYTYFTQFYQNNGINNLCLSSVLISNLIFDSPKLKESVTYLYIFENSFPILVQFTKGQDNAVLANGMFILNDFFINCSESDLNNLIKSAGLEIKKIH